MRNCQYVSCHEPYTIKDILLNCFNFQQTWNKLYKSDNLKNLFENVDPSNMNFIKEIGLYRRIYKKNFTKSAYLHCSVTNFWRKKYFQQYIFEGKIITSNTFDSRQNPPLQNMSMKPYLQNDSLQTIHTLFIRTYLKNLLGIKISLCSWYAIKLNKPNQTTLAMF